jgi:hypothetical protein
MTRKTGSSLANTTPHKALLYLRIMWGTIVFSQIAFISVLVLLVFPHQQPRPPQPSLIWMNIAMLVTVVPMTFLLRLTFFRRTQVNGQIPAPVYLRANIIFWAACESTSFFGLVVAMLNNTLWPTILVVILALALQALTFPLADKIAGL